MPVQASLTELPAPKNAWGTPPGKLGFGRSFGEDRSAAYFLYVSIGPQPKHSPKLRSAGVFTRCDRSPVIEGEAEGIAA